MNDQNRIAALKSTKLAQELTDDEAAVLAAVVTLRDLKPGEVLVKEGPSDNHLYVIAAAATSRVITNAGTDAPRRCSRSARATSSASSRSSTAPRTTRRWSPPTTLGSRTRAREARVAAGVASAGRLPRDAGDRAHGAQIQRRLSMQSVELTNYIYKQHGRY